MNLGEGVEVVRRIAIRFDGGLYPRPQLDGPTPDKFTKDLSSPKRRSQGWKGST